jgi:hypothetical protein
VFVRAGDRLTVFHHLLDVWQEACKAFNTSPDELGGDALGEFFRRPLIRHLMSGA